MGHYTASMKRVKGIAERMEGRMGWTKEKPTKAGWYWYRRLQGHNEVVLVDGKLMQTMDSFILVSDAVGEWQGPITPEE